MSLLFAGRAPHLAPSKWLCTYLALLNPRLQNTVESVFPFFSINSTAFIDLHEHDYFHPPTVLVATCLVTTSPSFSDRFATDRVRAASPEGFSPNPSNHIPNLITLLHNVYMACNLKEASALPPRPPLLTLVRVLDIVKRPVANHSLRCSTRITLYILL